MRQLKQFDDHLAAKYFKDISLSHAYCSTSERCSDTLELIIGHETPYTRLKELKEMNFGIFEGESEDLNPKSPHGYQSFFVPYGGEATDEVNKRMVEICTKIMEQDDHQTVLAVVCACSIPNSVKGESQDQ